MTQYRLQLSQLAIFLVVMALAGNAASQPSVVLKPFANETGEPSLDALAPAISELVASELVTRFECNILRRGHASDMAYQNWLVRIENRHLPGELPTADLVVIGALQSVGPERRCSIVVRDLHRETEDPPVVLALPEGATPSEVAREITEFLVNRLMLQPRQKPVSPFSTVSGNLGTWAVLPFHDYTGSDEGAAGLADQSAVWVEAALEQSGAEMQILSQESTAEVWREIQADHSADAFPSTLRASHPAMEVDYFVSGTLSSGEAQPDSIRIDLHRLSARDGSISAAAWGEVDSPEEVEAKMQALVLEMLRMPEPGPLPVATTDQRSAETFFYLRRANVNPSRAGNTVAGRIQRLHYLEGILLTAHDQHALLAPAVDQLPGRFFPGWSEWHVYQRDASGVEPVGEPLRTRALRLFDSMAARTGLPEEEQAVLRANVSLLAGDYQTVLDLLGPLDPRRSPLRGQWLLAAAQFSLGEYEEAKRTMTQWPRQWQERGNANNEANGLAARIYHALDEPEREFEALKRIQFGSRQTRGDLVRYFHLLGARSGPETALEQIANSATDIQRRPLVQLEAARFHRELGNLDQARRIYGRLLEHRNLLLRDGGTRELFAAIQQEAEEVGGPVTILPEAPLPQDSLTFVRERGQYDAEWLTRQLAYTHPRPHDAIYVVAITGEDLFGGRFRFIYSQMNQFGTLLSFHRWARNPHYTEENLGELLARVVAAHLYRLSCDANQSWPACTHNFCVTPGSTSIDGPAAQKFAFCYDCQQAYAHSDFDAMQAYFFESRSEVPEPQNNEERVALERYHSLVGETR